MAKLKDSVLLTRREALRWSTTLGLGAALSNPAFGSDSVKTAAHQEPGNVSTPRSAVAKTQYGKVRGFVDGGVLTFKGVPYGATTAGENRWLPAKPPAPWTDEYPALVYGGNCVGESQVQKRIHVGLGWSWIAVASFSALIQVGVEPTPKEIADKPFVLSAYESAGASSQVICPSSRAPRARFTCPHFPHGDLTT